VEYGCVFDHSDERSGVRILLPTLLVQIYIREMQALCKICWITDFDGYLICSSVGQGYIHLNPRVANIKYAKLLADNKTVVS